MSIGPTLSEGWLPERPENVAWEVATLFPDQGEWTDEAYFELTDGSNRRVELVDGCLEFLPMPTDAHQQLSGFLYQALLAFVAVNPIGFVPFPPIRVRISAKHVREPDVLFLRQESFHKRHNLAWDGADLLMEVVSGSKKDRERDYLKKVADYASIGVEEYWIVDPQDRCVLVNSLEGETYREHGRYGPGQVATSAMLDGFKIGIDQLFAVADEVPE